MLTLTRSIIIATALLLSVLLSSCGALGQIWPGQKPTVEPTRTSTPIPLPTSTAPRPPTAVPTSAPTRTALPPTSRPPTTAPVMPTQAAAPAPAAPAAPQVPGISNFTARFTGRALEGSFQVNGEPINYIYHIQRVGVAGNQLQFTGAIDYTRANGQKGSVPNLSTLITTEGDSCERIKLDVAPVSLPEWGVTLPAQHLSYNLADMQGNASAAIGAVCQLARAVQTNPNNPIVSFMLSQINSQLGQ